MGPNPGHAGGPQLPRRRVRKLLRRFDRSTRKVRKKVHARYGREFADVVLERTRVEYAQVLPETPYFGGAGNIFDDIIELNAQIVAFNKAMSAHGRSAEDAVGIYFEIFNELHQAIPGPARWAAQRFFFSPLFLKLARRFAGIVEQHPEGWKIEFFQDGEEEDWRFECTECAVITFYRKHDAMELAPYCNFFDYIQSRTFGLGMENPTSIGRGDEVCVERMKRGRQTPVPENLIELVEQRRVSLPG